MVPVLKIGSVSVVF